MRTVVCNKFARLHGLVPAIILVVIYRLCFPSVLATQIEKKNPAPAKGPLFETEVLSILEAKCFRCHGVKVQNGKLDLRTREGILKGSETGPVVVPGKPDSSTMYLAIRDGMMPAL